jgi:hypothetical protein
METSIRWEENVGFHGYENKNAYKILVGEPQGKRIPGRSWCRSKDATINFKEVSYVGFSIEMAQDRTRRRTFVNRIINLRAPSKQSSCPWTLLYSAVTLSLPFPSQTLFKLHQWTRRRKQTGHSAPVNFSELIITQKQVTKYSLFFLQSVLSRSNISSCDIITRLGII